MRKPKPTDLHGMAQEFAERSIVTQATARLIEQVLTEVHTTRIAPLEAEVARLKAKLHKAVWP